MNKIDRIETVLRYFELTKNVVGFKYLYTEYENFNLEKVRQKLKEWDVSITLEIDAEALKERDRFRDQLKKYWDFIRQFIQRCKELEELNVWKWIALKEIPNSKDIVNSFSPDYLELTVDDIKNKAQQTRVELEILAKQIRGLETRREYAVLKKLQQILDRFSSFKDRPEESGFADILGQIEKVKKILQAGNLS